MARGWGEISDKINRELFKWKESRRRDQGKQGTYGMMIYFVLLTSGTICDKGIDKGEEAWPPKVMFDDSFGAEMFCMSHSRAFVQRGDERVMG